MSYSWSSEDLAKLPVEVVHDFQRDGIAATLKGGRALENGECRRILQIDPPKNSSNSTIFALSHDRKMIALSAGSVVSVFGFEDGEMLACLRHAHKVDQLHFDPSDRLLATFTRADWRGQATKGESVQIWDVEEEKEAFRKGERGSQKEDDQVSAEKIQQAMLQAGRSALLPTTEAEGEGHSFGKGLWSISEIEESFVPEIKKVLQPALDDLFRRHAQLSCSCTTLEDMALPSFSSYPWSPDGRYLLALRDCAVQPERRNGNSQDILVMQVRQDRHLKSGNSSDGVKEAIVLTGHEGPIMWASFSPNGRWIGSSSWDQKVRIFSAETGHLVHTFNEGTNQSWTGAFSPDSTMIAAGNGDAKLRIWNIGSGSLEHELELQYKGESSTRWIRALAWSSDSTRLLAGSDGHAVLYKFSVNGDRQVEQEQTFRCEIAKSESVPFARQTEIQKVHISKDGNRLGVRFGAGETHVYDVDKNEKWVIVQSLKASERKSCWPIQMAFGDDKGRILLCGDLDGKVRVWDISH